MATKKISQAEARRLYQKIDDLENFIYEQKQHWSRSWPGGILIASIRPGEVSMATISTARKLGHAVVVTTDGESLLFYAVGL